VDNTITAHSSPTAVALRLVLAHLTANDHQRGLVVVDLLTGGVADVVGVVDALVTIAKRELVSNYGEAGAVGICAKRLGALTSTN
jgi:hypothetical protein